MNPTHSTTAGSAPRRRRALRRRPIHRIGRAGAVLLLFGTTLTIVTTGVLAGVPAAGAASAAAAYGPTAGGRPAVAAPALAVRDLSAGSSVARPRPRDGGVPMVTSTMIPDATTGQSSYDTFLQASGGTQPYSWSTPNGDVPGFLTVDGSSGEVTANSVGNVGSYSFGIAVTDANGVTSATQAVSLNVQPAPSMDPNTPPTAIAGSSTYSDQLTASGGVSPLTFSSLNIPSWLSLDASTGEITAAASGTTTTPGHYPFDVTVTDANNVSATSPLHLDLYVDTTPQVTPGSLPPATVGQGSGGQGSYGAQLNETGGTGTMTFTSTGLANGLQLSTAGGLSVPNVITGPPGPLTFNVVVTDAKGVSSTPQPFTITINPAPAVPAQTLKAATVGQKNYSMQINATGGTSQLKFSTPDLPATVSMSTTGLLTSSLVGAAPKTYPMHITVTDLNQVSATNLLNIVVNRAPAVVTRTIPAGTTATAYAAKLAAAGGTAPLTFEPASPALPAFLKLSTAGVLTSTKLGVPASYKFGVKVVDANGVVSPPQTLTLLVRRVSATVVTLMAPSVVWGHEQVAKFTVSLSPRAPLIPSGKVYVREGAVTLCTVTLSKGAGSCTPGATALAPGKYTVAALYLGDTNFSPSQSAGHTWTVARAATATALALSATSVAYGKETSERFSVTIRTQFAGPATGTVTVKSGTTAICLITLAAGKGACVPKNAKLLAPGTHPIVAVYGGDAHFNLSASPAVSLNVTSASKAPAPAPIGASAGASPAGRAAPRRGIPVGWNYASSPSLSRALRTISFSLSP